LGLAAVALGLAAVALGLAAVALGLAAVALGLAAPSADASETSGSAESVDAPSAVEAAGFFLPRPRPPRRRRRRAGEGAPASEDDASGAEPSSVEVDPVVLEPSDFDEDPLSAGARGPSVTPAPPAVSPSVTLPVFDPAGAAPFAPPPRPRDPPRRRGRGFGVAFAVSPSDPSEVTAGDVVCSSWLIPRTSFPSLERGAPVVGRSGFAGRGTPGQPAVRGGPLSGSTSSWLYEDPADATTSVEPSGASSRTRETLSRRRPPGRGRSGSIPGAGRAVATPHSYLTRHAAPPRARSRWGNLYKG
jgi:hypothetical protein